MPLTAARAAAASESLPELRERMFALPPKTSGLEQLLHFEVRINDGPNYYMMVKDIVVQRLYHFTAARPDPLILDCGSNIGVSVLYFKHLYPHARITAFEPDASVLPLLEENLRRNCIHGVTVVNAAVGAAQRDEAFRGDGKYAGALARHVPRCEGHLRADYSVPCLPLSGYVTEPIDLLKLNVEGAECEVIAELGPRLRQIDQILIEYHHLPGLPRTLHRILAALDAAGFEYLLHHFDYETNSGVRPPFRLAADSRYFLMIYAKRAH
jgi:FkbM family methyltransferase